MYNPCTNVTGSNFGNRLNVFYAAAVFTARSNCGLEHALGFNWNILKVNSTIRVQCSSMITKDLDNCVGQNKITRSASSKAATVCNVIKATLQCYCNVRWPSSKRDDFGSRRPSSNEMFQFTSQHLTAVNVQSFQQQELNLGALISLNIRHESMLG